MLVFKEKKITIGAFSKPGKKQVEVLPENMPKDYLVGAEKSEYHVHLNEYARVSALNWSKGARVFCHPQVVKY